MQKVSFIIVALNADNAISFSLGSLAKQDYPHDLIEVILVDSCSQDRTRQVMLDFKENDKSFARVAVLDNPKRYLACGWNVALKEVKGDIVIRVDAHTLFPEDFISKNVKLIDEGKDICGGRVMSILQKDTPWNRALLSAENSMFGGGFTFFRRGEISRYTDTLAFAAYRKVVFDAVGPYDERLVRTEDNEMHYRMRRAGYRFFFTPDIVSYRYNRNSLKGLFRQKYMNGYWVGLTHAVSPMAFSVYYLVPLMFLLSLIVLILLCFFTPWPLIVMLTFYSFLLMFALIVAIIKDGFYWPILVLPFIIMGLHLCYGVGTAIGLYKEGIMNNSKYCKKGTFSMFVYKLSALFSIPAKSIVWVYRLTFCKE